jgi:hypothetical protein
MRREATVGRLGVLVLGTLLGLLRAQAADLYVSTQGNDSNPGTSAQPLRTITRAYSLAGAGTTIIVMPGVYTDYTTGWGIRLGRSGTASSPIVLKSQVRGKAVIDGGNASDRNVCLYIDGSFNVVDGFEIRNGPNGGIKIWSNGNRILNNEIHHNGNPASTSTNGKDGIYSSKGTRDNYYAGNYIHDNGRTGSNLDHGLYLCGQNEVIINNILFRNASSGIQIAGYSTVSGMKVYNNVMAYNKDGVILWLALSGVDIKNNIIYKNWRDGIHSYDAHGGGVTLDRNIIYGSGAVNLNLTGGGSDYSYTLGGNPNTDPLFVNPASASFDPHLSGASPAIKAGLNFYSLFTTDRDGAARPATGAWDLGPYVTAANTAPAISTVASQSVVSGRTTGQLPFTVNDAETAAGSLAVTATSSNPTLAPASAIVLAGSGSSRTVSVTPAAGQTGTATITLSVSDGSLTASTSFTLSVRAPVAPVITLTTPSVGATYSAPANIQLAASVLPNDFTISKVQFFNGSALLGESAVPPYVCSWNNAGVGGWSLSARAVCSSGALYSSPAVAVTVNAPPPPPSNLRLAVSAGAVTAPFYVSNGMLAQKAYTSLAVGGRATWSFTIPTAGD